jgi:hypothetical protein
MVTLPPLPPVTVAVPPLPPLAPVTFATTTLVAFPVLPEVALEIDDAPVFAEEIAVPTATAFPVRPEFPVLPDFTVVLTWIEPLMALLVTVIVEVTGPLLPVFPELPEMAVGLEVAVDDEAPVLPVLVAEDWATTAPEAPDVATGLMFKVTELPFPPLTSTTVMESPAWVGCATAGGALSTIRLALAAMPTSTASRDLRNKSSSPSTPLLARHSLTTVGVLAHVFTENFLVSRGRASLTRKDPGPRTDTHDSRLRSFATEGEYPDSVGVVSTVT